MLLLRKHLLCLVVFVFTISMVNAQSIRSKDGKQFFGKVGVNLYKPTPNSPATYRVDGDKLFVAIQNQYDEKQKGYIKTNGAVTYFYDAETDDIIGYSKETEGVIRYFRAVANKSEILKESYLATFYDGNLSVEFAPEKSYDYLVDNEFSLLAVGFILFYF